MQLRVIAHDAHFNQHNLDPSTSLRHTAEKQLVAFNSEIETQIGHEIDRQSPG